ncbi:MAG: DUF6434 domain-containing protein [Bacteroidota bacterium]
MSRPSLTEHLAVEDFLDYYWLKAELVGFCQRMRLPTAGPKVEVRERVAAYLRDGTVLKPAPKRSGPVDPMPETLTGTTLIGRGWTCGQRLRAFFEAEVGPAFRFNRALIDFVKTGVGRSLSEAVAVWRASKENPERPIEAQLEFNRHTRAYHRHHPDATREEVLRAWKEKRSTRRSEWNADEEAPDGA